MKGAILDFSLSSNTGVISGDDGQRYTFGGSDWKGRVEDLRSGSRVDFLPNGSAAHEVYLAPDVLAHPAAAPSMPPGLDHRYLGLYCSSDDRVALGLCAGLAHKFGADVGAVRLVVFVLMWFILWFPYLLAVFLPKLPTKGVPNPR